MILSHRLHTAPGAEPERVAFLLHGFLGQGRNWDAIARRFVAARPQWGVITPDLRLHGKSQGAHPPHTLQACAEDLSRLAQHLGVHISAILGHSFGGKVALTFAREATDLEQLWVLDSTPRAMTPGGSALEMLARLRRLGVPAQSRGGVVEALVEDGLSAPVAQWVATNLSRTDAGLVWNLDLDALDLLLADFYRVDAWSVVEAPPDGLSIHVVQATQSDILTIGDLDRLAAAGAGGRVHVHPLNSGHWVNVGDPQGLLALLEQWL